MDDNLQLIDENKVLHPVNEYLTKNGLIKNGLNYHVVSVFGSQSTGKSTLLNSLFGTDFRVMSEANRSQTTKGIWMARAQLTMDADAVKPEKRRSLGNPVAATLTPATSAEGVRSDESSDEDFLNVVSSSNILVLDVEGTDGRERGEDQDFERKSALFALATSEVLIVNMWENQVGLYNGANMGLLKTVFEVNLSLFQSNSGSKNPTRSMILFVIRDHLGTTPLENLSTTLLEDLHKHWSNISKPEGLKDSKMEDFFDIGFHALPHKILLPDKFQEEVGNLSKKFINPSGAEFVFKPVYHRNVPIDGWQLYSQNVWEQIELNKDLDIPSQQILVAQFRCEDISAVAWDTFTKGLVENDPTKSFAATISALRKEALEYYDTTASRYTSSVYLQKRKELIGKIDSKLLEVRKSHLEDLRKQLISDYEGSLSSLAHLPFLDRLTSSRQNVVDRYSDVVKESSLGVLPTDDELRTFNAVLDSRESELKTSELTGIKRKSLRYVDKQLRDNIDIIFSASALSDSPSHVWDKVKELFENTLETGLKSYDGGKDFKIGGSEELYSETLTEITALSWKSLDSQLKNVTRPDNVLLRLRERFEDQFKYDKNKVPIIWKPSDDIQTPFVTARDSTLEVFPVFATAKLSTGEFFEPSPAILTAIQNDEETGDEFSDPFYERISKSKQIDISDKFKTQANNMYVEAQRSTTPTVTQVPFYVLVLLIVLGWNEFMAVLRNPLLFMLVLIIGSGSYVAYQLNLWGPLLSVSGAMSNKALEISKEKLREFLDVPEHSTEQPIELDDLSQK